jgi:hypothetical protein
VTARRTFLAWFLCALALASGAAFAVRIGAAEAIWRGDASHVTTAIAVLCVVTVVWLGRVAWLTDAAKGVEAFRWKPEWPSLAFAHLAERLSVMLGLLGTTLGLSLQASALAASGAASFGALATSLYTTGTGIGSAVIISVLAFVVERGAR